MSAYIVRRILLMLPTLLGILFVSFVVVQFAPGGPVDRVIAQLSGADTGGLSRVSGGGGDFGNRGQVAAGAADTVNSKYRGAQGLDPAFIKSLEKQFGFDKPAPERFALMVWNYTRFDFGKSYFRDISVIQLIKEKLPVSMSLGIWMTLLSYLISIPLGIRKAVKDGTPFDTWTSGVIIVGFAIARADLGRLVDIPLVLEDHRLFLASDAATDRDGDFRLRDHDAAHQELVSRRDPQAIRHHRARQGLQRAAGAL
jgi:microcin C transport system permease protein